MVGLSARAPPGLRPARPKRESTSTFAIRIKTRWASRSAAAATSEIKGLISRRDKNLDFAGCTSPIELWAKWASRTLNLGGLPLIHVEKQRWKRSFSVHVGAVSELATSSEPVPRQSGCDAELTLLKGPDMAPWWTLGFEAYGELDKVEAVLSRTVSLMTRRCPPPLTPGEAIGYPSWIKCRRW